ncbi:MAG: DoxX family protein [Rhodospirillaceae bacterium]|jgi:putative oxidoreductase|nr:DoxX family protein [Rhodospirillaceae bacterium]MBT5242072.1 DoxX family protein [Rhodospirillaceae bacterium]MBT5565797.1 DoxX family protein [Rhodospirillaceae bacterium]MBT6090309.1 DoxX family protein [Rhodospirillaceae bacterium]MBT6959703.1 DoxX family protein [Rhodospirillaceae bacterium]
MTDSQSLTAKIAGLYGPIITKLETLGPPVVDLAVRLWIGLVFFRSGLQKLDDWESTLFLFEYEYVLPVIPFEWAAYMGTAFELAMPILLFVGLAARLAAVPLLTMALTIQFILGANSPAYNDFNHFAWMTFLLVIIARGPGKLSIDHWLRQTFMPGQN